MEVGVDVWLRDHSGSQAWIPAFVHAKSTDQDGKPLVIVKTDDDKEFQFRLSEEDEELNDVKLRNSKIDSSIDNLINLPYLNEPAILFSLQERYSRSEIYTYTGPILIAVNPFKKINIYSSQALETYYNYGLLKSQGIENAPLPPHIYAIADSAYRSMMGNIHPTVGNSQAGTSANQAILISGESGAGKTESTKIVLKYLTTVGNSSSSGNHCELAVGSIMEKILQSNPILEAFGNAKTIRNDNSSRFGKYIELNFNRRGQLIGGLIRTYLLEKVRLPTQQSGERNFHIFYQMAAGASLEEREEWKIGNIQDFYYTNQGKIFELRHVSDKDEFILMKQALHTLNFDLELQTSLFRILSGLLHLGELHFISDSDGEGSVISSDDATQQHLAYAADLCGINANDLIRTFTLRMITARDETYGRKLTPVQASDARDALAKAIYGAIFEWIIRTINKSIEVDAKLIRANIGVLDIFGFESFQHNSFEQLCINYTNEALQQQFNQFIFKMEQKEYEKEKIEWSFIEFPDNQDCLDLIENKPSGILAMIDDECKLPKASDEKLANRMYKAFENHKRFSAPQQLKRDSKFAIRHYAGLVVYSTLTFVDKNKDELPRESTLVLQASTQPLLALLFKKSDEPPEPTNARKGATAHVTSSVKTMPSASTSVGSQFKEQLNKLMEMIYMTTPHYIRCLKPNDENVADHFNRLRTTEQLRYGGVLEAVRVARSGFPVRLSHFEFYTKYRPLLTNANNELPRVISSGSAIDSKLYCNNLISALWDQIDISRQNIQIGISKVFLRKQAHDIFEAKRSKRIVDASIIIQSFFRCIFIRRKFIISLMAVKVIQRFVRGYLARLWLYRLRRDVSSIIIQSYFRRYIAQKRYLQFIWSVVRLQSNFRSLSARKITKDMFYKRNVIRLQRFLRGIVKRKVFVSIKKAVLWLQCKYRQRVAKAKLRELKTAAKDIGRLKQSNEALKAEIEMLRAKAAEEALRAKQELQKQLEIQASLANKAELENALKEMQELKNQLEAERSLRISAEKQVTELEMRNISLESNLQQALLRAESVSSSRPLRMSASFASPMTPERPIIDPPSVLVASPAPAPASALAPVPVSSESTHLDAEIVARASIEKLTNELEKEKTESSKLKVELKRLQNIAKTLSEEISSLRDSKSAKPFNRRNSVQHVDLNPKSSQSQSHNVQPPLHGRDDLAIPARLHSQSSQSSQQQLSSPPTLSKPFASAQTPSQLTVASHSPVPLAATLAASPASPPVAPPAAANSIQAEVSSILGKYDKNFDLIKTKLVKGIFGLVWEGQKISKLEVIMKLENNRLIFNSGRKMMLFSKPDISPIEVRDIITCMQGSDIPSEKSNEQLFITILASKSGSSDQRKVAFRFENKDERNSLLTILRTLVSETQYSSAKPAPPVPPSTLAAPSASPTTSAVRASRRQSVRERVIEDSSKNAQSNSLSNQKDSDPANSNEALEQERIARDRLQIQNVQFTKEIVELNEQLQLLKKKELEQQALLDAKEKQIAQEQQFCSQLGRRLEQVLMDKEEALDELEAMKEKISVLTDVFHNNAELLSMKKK